MESESVMCEGCQEKELGKTTREDCFFCIALRNYAHAVAVGMPIENQGEI